MVLFYLLFVFISGILAVFHPGGLIFTALVYPGCYLVPGGLWCCLLLLFIPDVVW